MALSCICLFQVSVFRSSVFAVLFCEQNEKCIRVYVCVLYCTYILTYCVPTFRYISIQQHVQMFLLSRIKLANLEFPVRKVPDSVHNTSHGMRNVPEEFNNEFKVGRCRCFVRQSACRAALGITGERRRRAIHNSTEAAEKASGWLWIKRAGSTSAGSPG